jgi:hypothetical protein
MDQINVVGALVGGLLSFVVGALWYSPALFGRPWMAAAGLTEEQIESASVPRMILVTAPASLVAALVFAAFLGVATGPGFGAAAGVAAGAFWVGTSYAISYTFEQRPPALLAVNAGYHTVQFTVYGLSIGVANRILFGA